MSSISNSLRTFVRERAKGRCEYCLLTNQFQVGGFEIDHIQPSSRGGKTVDSNLAFACPACNGAKLDRVAALDQQTGEAVPLFNPRLQDWHDHFQWSVDEPHHIVGKTACGRASIRCLNLNDADMVRLRTLYAELGFDSRKADFE